MTHSFQFDPNTILGVPSGASLREIRDAYHQKSLKYHPDKGGDEWAFRMVARAYEILSTARVVNRASDEFLRPAQAQARPHPETGPEPMSNATWAKGFGPATTKAAPGAARGRSFWLVGVLLSRERLAVPSHRDHVSRCHMPQVTVSDRQVRVAQLLLYDVHRDALSHKLSGV